MMRYQVCKLSGPAEGVFDPERERITGADFETKEEALKCAGVFPGTGHGYIYDWQEGRPVHLFSWLNREKGS